MRHPVVAGQFYPADKESLISMLSDFVKPNFDKRIKACVAPHAGYIYSGRTAGRIYSLLPPAETFVIIGPNHTGYGSMVAVSTDKWKTPLGEVEVDEEFIEAMPKLIIDTDEIAHRYEHSIEVQLPFLQFVHENFKIVPICLGMQDQETVSEVADEILKAEKETGKNVVLIASSDMHHYLPDRKCREADAKVVESILSMDVSKYYKTIYDMQASGRGYGCIGVAILYARAHGCKAELVHYSTSGDVADKGSVVGYAAIAFKRQA